MVPCAAERCHRPHREGVEGLLRERVQAVINQFLKALAGTRAAAGVEATVG